MLRSPVLYGRFGSWYEPVRRRGNIGSREQADEMPEKKIFIIVDYRGQLYCPLKGTARTLDLQLIESLLGEAGYSTTIKQFSDVDFGKEDYSGKIVIYQSSEDYDLRYKSFIEDIVLGLKLQGALLIPDFHHLRAHHNKVFMEILRTLTRNEDVTRGISTKCFGTLEEFERQASEQSYPAVIKTASGHTGEGVSLAHSPKEALSRVRKTSQATFWPVFLKNLRLSRHEGFIPESHHTRKFIVQNFIPGLNLDYRVVIFGKKYFVLERSTRRGDFRASGSGISLWPKEPPPGLLDYARRVKNAFDVPFLHMDVIPDGDSFALLEFQFLRFGTNSVQRSPHFFVQDDQVWKRVEEHTIIEEAFVTSIVDYLAEG